MAEEAPANAARLMIPNGTAVHLRLTQTVSSANARIGDPLDFIVEKDVRVDGFTVIRAGSRVQGSVIGVRGRRFFGVGGKVVFGLDSIALDNGETVGLSGRKVVKGSAHTWRMIAGIAVTALFYLPAAPVFLLTRGGNSTVLKGTEVTAQTDCDASVPSADVSRAAPEVAELNGMMQNLAPRVLTGEGREGDMVNVIFVGQKEDLQGAFQRAGWVKTDSWNPATMAWRLLLHRTHYTTLPMARFYMFGRQQDYSYALPDPDAPAARRHHIRIWKTKYAVDGNTLWAGAATHDVAITFALHGRMINHRIDPYVDAERDFVGSNLADKTPVHQEYLHSGNPVFEAQTATGEAYHSDSRILLLDLHQADVVTAVLSAPVSGSLAQELPSSSLGLQSSLK